MLREDSLLDLVSPSSVEAIACSLDTSALTSYGRVTHDGEVNADWGFSKENHKSTERGCLGDFVPQAKTSNIYGSVAAEAQTLMFW